MSATCTWRWNDTDQSWDLVQGPEGCDEPPPIKPGKGGNNHELITQCPENLGNNSGQSADCQCPDEDS